MWQGPARFYEGRRCVDMSSLACQPKDLSCVVMRSPAWPGGALGQGNYTLMIAGMQSLGLRRTTSSTCLDALW
ncbi:MAG: hypothetical protein ACYC5M_04820 [Anaerolineae bacterium]